MSAVWMLFEDHSLQLNIPDQHLGSMAGGAVSPVGVIT